MTGVMVADAGWDVDVIGSLTMDITETSGPLQSYSVTISTGTFCHVDISSVMGSGSYADFATALAAAINAAATAAGGSATWGVDGADGGIAPASYFIDASVNFTIAFTGAAGTRMAAILGLDSAGVTGASGSVSSTIRPRYTLGTQQGGPSGGTDDYEPDGIAEDAEADDGTHYGIARTAAPVYSDFAIRMETQAATFTRHATSSVPWTWRHLFEHARNVEPILIQTSTDGASWTEQTVVYLRADSARFKPIRSVADWDDRWDLDLKTRVLGRL